jgi:hypothetical protein
MRSRWSERIYTPAPKGFRRIVVFLWKRDGVFSGLF